MTEFVLRLPRGTRDFLPSDMVKRNYVEGVIRNVFERFGFQEVQTPIFETFDLFALRSGEEIRSKMFVFRLEEGEMTLRPELTAPVCRMIALGEMDMSKKPLRLFYIGQCFRYERPQAGRYREFWQAGVELMGSPFPEADAEIISLAVQVINELGLTNCDVKVGNMSVLRGFLEDNNIPEEVQNRLVGTLDIIDSSINKLQSYKIKLESGDILTKNELIDLIRRADELRAWKEFEYRRMTSNESLIPNKFKEMLSIDPRYYKIRSNYENQEFKKITNFIDNIINETQWIQKMKWIYYGITVKEGGKEKIVNIPKEVATTLLKMIDLVGKRKEVIFKAKELFAGFPSALKALMNYEIILDQLKYYGVTEVTSDLSLARGLEFYTGTVFEIDNPSLGAQKQICGGGRYDKLVSEFGGPSTPATGFAFGFDRLVLSLEKSGSDLPSAVRTDVYVVPVVQDVFDYAIEVLNKLRKTRINAEMEILRRKVSESLSFANIMNFPYVLIIGPKEKEASVVTIRYMKTKKEETASLENIMKTILSLQSSP